MGVDCFDLLRRQCCLNFFPFPPPWGGHRPHQSAQVHDPFFPGSRSPDFCAFALVSPRWLGALSAALPGSPMMWAPFLRFSLSLVGGGSPILHLPSPGGAVQTIFQLTSQNNVSSLEELSDPVPFSSGCMLHPPWCLALYISHHTHAGGPPCHVF